MNKKQFMDFMNREMEGMTYEQKMAMLTKMQANYLPDLITKLKKKEGYWVPKEKEKEYLHCENCHKYTLKKRCQTEMETKISVETTYIDCGYGDDDMEGEVERMITYKICPHCNHKQVVERLYLRKICEWNRREGRK